MGSSTSKGMEALLLSFIIAPTLILTVVEHHSSELLSDFGLSANATMWATSLTKPRCSGEM